MERFHAHVGSLERAFEQTPEVFQPVGMNVAFHIGYGVVDHLVLKLIKTLVGFQSISEDRGASKDVIAEFALQGFLFGVVYDLGAHPASALSAAFQNAHHGSLVLAASASNAPCPYMAVHVARLAADESLVCLDLARQFIADLFLMGETNPVKHKPCGFLADSQAPVNLPGRDAVLGVGDEPHSGKPLIEADGRILENGSDLDGKLTARMMGSALPSEMLCEKTDTGAAASRALHYAVWPALFGQIFEAVLRAGKVYDGLLKSADLRVFHVFSMSETGGLRKSIISLIRVHKPTCGE